MKQAAGTTFLVKSPLANHEHRSLHNVISISFIAMIQLHFMLRLHYVVDCQSRSVSIAVQEAEAPLSHTNEPADKDLTGWREKETAGCYGKTMHHGRGMSNLGFFVGTSIFTLSVFIGNQQHLFHVTYVISRDSATIINLGSIVFTCSLFYFCHHHHHHDVAQGSSYCCSC